MCRTCKVSDEFWLAGWDDVIAEKLPEGSVSSRWTTNVWIKRYERWHSSLGETLRKTACVPEATGDDLLALYQTAWEVSDLVKWPFDYIEMPPELTTENLERQSVPHGKQRQKLSRWLAAWIVKATATTIENAARIGFNPAAFGPAWASAVVGKIQDYVKAANGATIVLSAHPADIVFSSMFTTGWESCHAFGADSSDNGCHAAGNFAYVQSPNVLIAYAYDGKAPTAGFPRKKWRQLVMVDNDANLAHCMREYPSALAEFHHQTARKLIAQALTGSDKPTWRALDGNFGFPSAADSAPYLDGNDYSHTVIVTGENRHTYTKRPIHLHIPAAVCPACNQTNQGGVGYPVCNNCGGGGGRCERRCAHCHNMCEVSSDDDWEGWLTVNDEEIGPCCVDEFHQCRNCHNYSTDPTYSVYIFVNGYTSHRQYCRDCAENNGFELCPRCDSMTRSEDMARDLENHDDMCEDCAGNCGYAKCCECDEWCRRVNSDGYCPDCEEERPPQILGIVVSQECYDRIEENGTIDIDSFPLATVAETSYDRMFDYSGFDSDCVVVPSL